MQYTHCIADYTFSSQSRSASRAISFISGFTLSMKITAARSVELVFVR